MAQFLSGRRTNFNVGISSVTENTTSLQVIGNVGIGTTNADGRSLYVIGNSEVSGILTASRIYGEFTGGSISGTNIVGTALSISGISTLSALSITGLTTTRDLQVTGIATLNAISVGGTTGISQYVLTSTGTGLIWQAATAITGVTGINVVEDATGGLKYLAMQTGAGTTQTNNISSSQLVYNSTTTNLGIGTTNPTSKLTVQGDGKFTGVVTATTFIGNLTGYASTSGIATVAGYASIAGIATNLAGGAKNSIPYQTGVSTTGFISYGNPGDILTTDGANGAPYWAPLTIGAVVGQITVRDEGNVVGSATSITQLDFKGPNIIATANVGGNIATITVADYVSISGYSTNAGIATYATSAGIATYAPSAGIATYATSAGIATYATSAGIATYATNAGIATYAPNAGIATYAPNAGIATNIGSGSGGEIPYQSAANTTVFLANGSVGNLLQSNGGTSAPSWASPQGLTIGYANTAGISTFATNAGIATYATNAGIATYAPNAGISTYATNAGIATYATNAGIATYAPNAGIATYATTAGIATYATNAGIATYATTAGIATYATNAGIATNLKGGAGGEIPYQSAADTTSLLANGSPGNLLQSNGTTLAPSWASPQGLTIGYANTAGIATYATNAGIATNVIGGIASVTSLFVNTLGISTLGTVKISSGIVTATTGVVTYYGDGSNLTNLPTSIPVDNIATNSPRAITFIPTGVATTSRIGVNLNYLSFVPSNGGLLGINTNNPQYNIHVFGDGRFVGDITADNFYGTASYATTSGIATYATNIKGGAGGSIPYQTATDTTALLANGSAGNLLQSNGGTSAPSWASPQGLTIGYANTAGIASVAVKLQTSRVISLTGDVVGSVSFDGSGDVSIASTIQLNSVALGSDTTGDYVQSITGTANQISVSATSGEGSTPTLSIPNQFTAPQDVTVTRDLQVNRNLNVSGNITIGGTSAIIYAQQLKVYDPDLILGIRTDAFGNDISNDTTANHGGIAIASTEGSPLANLNIAGIETLPATYKKIMWFKAGAFAGLNTDAWLTNYAFGVGTTQMPAGARFAAGNFVVGQDDITAVRNINSTGIITATSFSGNATSATYATNAGIATYATNAGIATNLAGGTIGNVAYQSSNNATTFVTNPGVSGKVLLFNGSVPVWGDVSSATGSFGGISVQDETNPVGTSGSITTLNFVGGNISATATTGVNGIATITIADYVSISGYSTNAGIATYATTAGIATYATTAGIATYATSSGISTYATSAGIATYATSSGVSTSVIGGIASVTQIQVTGISTFTNGPVFIGSGTSTGTTSQRLQVTGGAYVSGNLGIGTTNPTSKLHVIGDSNITGVSTFGNATTGIVINAGIITSSNPGVTTVTYYGDGSKLSGVTATAAPGGSSGQVQFNNAGSMGGASFFNYDSTNNRVGIGTSVPTARLSVANPTTGNSLLLVNDNLSDGSLFRVSNSAGQLLVDVDSGGTILFPTAGNVGIGTTLSTPTTKLHVDGDVTARFYYGDGRNLTNLGLGGIGIATQASSATPVYPTLVSSAGVNTVGIATTGLSFITFTNTLQVGSAITMYGSTGIISATSYSGDGSRLTNVNGTPGGSSGQVQFNNAGSMGGASFFNYDSTNNRVGIGTSVPTARLSVANPTTGNSLLLVNDNLSDGSLFRVSNSAGQLLVDVDSGGTILFPTAGNVGIGTTLSTPTTKLHVDGDVRIARELYDTNNVKGTSGQVLQSVGTGISWVNFSGGGSLSISTSTSSQAQYLTFATGVGAATSLGIDTNIGLVFIPSTERLGIGTTNPSYNLHVNGSFGATTKSFIIDHPTKEGKKLQYGSLESPYHGIRLTGSSTIKTGKCVVELPDYIHTFVKEEGININITNIKHGKVLWVDEVDVANNRFIIMTEETSGEYDFYWDFTAIRKDVEDMIVEF